MVFPSEAAIWACPLAPAQKPWGRRQQRRGRSGRSAPALRLRCSQNLVASAETSCFAWGAVALGSCTNALLLKVGDRKGERGSFSRLLHLLHRRSSLGSSLAIALARLAAFSKCATSRWSELVIVIIVRVGQRGAPPGHAEARHQEGRVGVLAQWLPSLVRRSTRRESPWSVNTMCRALFGVELLHLGLVPAPSRGHRIRMRVPGLQAHSRGLQGCPLCMLFLLPRPSSVAALPPRRAARLGPRDPRGCSRGPQVRLRNRPPRRPPDATLPHHALGLGFLRGVLRAQGLQRNDERVLFVVPRLRPFPAPKHLGLRRHQAQRRLQEPGRLGRRLRRIARLLLVRGQGLVLRVMQLPRLRLGVPRAMQERGQRLAALHARRGRLGPVQRLEGEGGGAVIECRVQEGYPCLAWWRSGCCA